jgi:DNA mismatch endonuclease (patch repair protein)
MKNTKTPQFRGLKPSSALASLTKSRNRSTNTAAELQLRRTLWRRGLRYRLHAGSLPGKPDLVFPGRRVVVFCDGDFWHGRDWEQRRARLQCGANSAYWVAKIQSNIERDRRVVATLEDAGWKVVRLWETDIKRNPTEAADRVCSALRSAAE